MKSEPKVYSLADLQQEQQTLWEGVRNYQARNFLRQMAEGDLAFFYHSNIVPAGIMGLMSIITSNIIDPTQFDPESKYYDPRVSPESPRWYTVRVEFVKAFPRMISLHKLKQEFNPEELWVVRKGNRLSVLPVTETVAQKILGMADEELVG